MNSNESPQPLSSDEFKALIDGIKSIYEGLFDRGFKLFGVFAIVLGWFAAKPNPLPQICNEIYWVSIAEIVVGLCTFPVIFLYIHEYMRAKKCEKALKEACVTENIYSCYIITKKLLIFGIGIQVMMLAFIGLSIHLTYGTEIMWNKECHPTKSESLKNS
jgi:hypothetical protein